MNRDRFRSQFAILCTVAILATSAAAAPATPSASAVWISIWDIPCFFWPDGPMCPKKIKEVVPTDPQPTPPCDPQTQSCPS